VTSDGIAFCWGDDSSGQLGDGGPGAQQRSAVPVAVSGGLRFAVLQAGYYQTCGLTVSGVAYCWGQNDSGQNGDGTTLNRHVPFLVAMEGSMTVVSPGDRFVCGLGGSATYCWGANRSGELGTGAPSGSAVPVPLAGAPTFASVVTSIGASTVPTAEAYGCGLASGGAGVCWGGMIRGMRNGAATGFAPLGDGIRFQSLAPGSEHVCGLSREGYAYCAGGNYSGQLGDGTFEDRATAVPVEGPGE
jgi:alpha-tubulin suppressor-like RCC1 family protein